MTCSYPLLDTVEIHPLCVYCAPTERDDISPGDPRWLGAWWLGMLILAAVTVPLIFLMWPFPRHLPNAPNKAVGAKMLAEKKDMSLKGTEW